MNCKKCGNVLAPTDTFCKVCGEPVTNESPSVTPTPNPAGMTFMTPPSEPIINQNNQAIDQNIEAPTQNIVPNVMEPTGMPGQQMPNSAPIQAPPVQNMMPANTNENINIQGPVPVVPNNGPSILETPVNPSVTPINESLATPYGMPQQMNIESNNISQGSQPSVVEEEQAEPAKKKSSPIAVAILLIILIAVIAYIVIYLTKPFDKNKNGNNGNTPAENTPVENQNETATTKPAWMTYLQTQNITNITLERFPLEGEKKTATLTKDDLNNIFSKLANYQLIKRYYEGAGVADGDILTIAYTKDDNSYEVKITNGILWAGDVSLKDEGLRNALEESEHTIENEELKDKDGTFYNFVFGNYDKAILDEYFVTEKIEENQ